MRSFDKPSPRPRAESPSDDIVVGVDGSPRAIRALRFTAEEACEGELHAVSHWQIPTLAYARRRGRGRTPDGARAAREARARADAVIGVDVPSCSNVVVVPAND